MKRFLLLSLLLVGLAAKSQQAFGTHGTWHYKFGGFGHTHVFEVSYEKDSLFNGKTYQALAVEGERLLTWGANIGTVERVNKSYVILRTENDTVYRVTRDSSELILYDFSAQVGDSWVIGPPDTALGCIDSARVTVTEVGFDTINGVELKYFRVETDTNAAFFYREDKIYERMGSESLMFSPLFKACDDGIWIDMSVPSMRCYEDSMLGLVYRAPDGKACDEIPGVGVAETDLVTFELSPNPSDGLLQRKPLFLLTWWSSTIFRASGWRFIILTPVARPV